jgi:hypothetical protein
MMSSRKRIGDRYSTWPSSLYVVDDASNQHMHAAAPGPFMCYYTATCFSMHVAACTAASEPAESERSDDAF